MDFRLCKNEQFFIQKKNITISLPDWNEFFKDPVLVVLKNYLNLINTIIIENYSYKLLTYKSMLFAKIYVTISCKKCDHQFYDYIFLVFAWSGRNFINSGTSLSYLLYIIYRGGQNVHWKWTICIKFVRRRSKYKIIYKCCIV